MARNRTDAVPSRITQSMHHEFSEEDAVLDVIINAADEVAASNCKDGQQLLLMISKINFLATFMTRL